MLILPRDNEKPPTTTLNLSLAHKIHNKTASRDSVIAGVVIGVLFGVVLLVLVYFRLKLLVRSRKAEEKETRLEVRPRKEEEEVQHREHTTTKDAALLPNGV